MQRLCSSSHKLSELWKKLSVLNQNNPFHLWTSLEKIILSIYQGTDLTCLILDFLITHVIISGGWAACHCIFLSRSQYFFLITIFFLSLLFSGCDVSGQQLGTRDGESEPEPERGRPTTRTEIRCTAVQFPHCTKCCTAHVQVNIRSKFLCRSLFQVREQICLVSLFRIWPLSIKT